MGFPIADAFNGNLARLTRDQQKAVKKTAFKLSMSLAAPGLCFQKLGQGEGQKLLVGAGQHRDLDHRARTAASLWWMHGHCSRGNPNGMFQFWKGLSLHDAFG